MRERSILAAVVVCSLCPAAALAAEKSLTADRVEVRLVLAGDGSVAVTETTTFRFVGGPFTSVARRLSTRDTDGIVGITAEVDGVQYPPGRQAGTIRIEREDGVTVTWRLTPASDATRTVTLRYRVRGATERKDGADVLVWHALPIRRTYTASATTVVITWPTGAALAAAPLVSNGTAKVDGAVQRATIAAGGSLAPGAGLDFTLTFAAGGVAQQTAAWQSRRDRGRAAAPAVAMGAGSILLALTFWVVVFQIGHRREPVPAAVAASRTTPPDALSVGLAAALVSPGARASWSHALGTLVDLARRGVLRVEGRQGHSGRESREYLINLVTRPAGLLAHEAGLLDLLFVAKGDSVTSVTLSGAGRAAQSRLKLFTLPVSDELVAAGFVSPERVQTRAALVRWGLLLVVLALAGFFGAAFMAPSYGAWPLLVPGAVLTAAVTVLILASLFSVMSTTGLLAAASWQSFFGFIRQVARGHLSVADPAWFDRYLPFAVVRNAGRDWVRAFERSGRVQEPPAWFTLVETASGRHSSLRQFADMLARAQAAGAVKHGTV